MAPKQQRQINHQEAWILAQDTKTQNILSYQQTKRPDMSTTRAKARYKQIGTMKSEDDAELFIAFKEMGLSPDAVAYLNHEHVITTALEKGCCADLKQLKEMSARVKKETGRSCFGNCKSLDGDSSCSRCFSMLNPTWSLCASIKCIKAHLNVQREEK